MIKINLSPFCKIVCISIKGAFKCEKNELYLYCIRDENTNKSNVFVIEFVLKKTNKQKY